MEQPLREPGDFSVKWAGVGMYGQTKRRKKDFNLTTNVCSFSVVVSNFSSFPNWPTWVCHTVSHQLCLASHSPGPSLLLHLSIHKSIRIKKKHKKGTQRGVKLRKKNEQAI